MQWVPLFHLWCNTCPFIGDQGGRQSLHDSNFYSLEATAFCVIGFLGLGFGVPHVTITNREKKRQKNFSFMKTKTWFLLFSYTVQGSGHQGSWGFCKITERWELKVWLSNDYFSDCRGTSTPKEERHLVIFSRLHANKEIWSRGCPLSPSMNLKSSTVFLFSRWGIAVWSGTAAGDRRTENCSELRHRQIRRWESWIHPSGYQGQNKVGKQILGSLPIMGNFFVLLCWTYFASIFLM